MIQESTVYALKSSLYFPGALQVVCQSYACVSTLLIS